MGPPPMGPPPMGPPPMGPPPTDQGVGALLGPGMTPPPPPPQMMAAVGGAVKKLQGGNSRPIQRFDEGGEAAREAELREFWSKRWAIPGDPPEGFGEAEKKAAKRKTLEEFFNEDYQDIMKIMSPTEQQNRLAKSQLFFDAARAGLNLAANRDSQGNPLRGSTASKFAAVTEPVLAGVPKASKAAQSAAGEAAARQAAIQSALATRTTERATAARREEAEILAKGRIAEANIAAKGRNLPTQTMMAYVGQKDGVEDIQYLDVGTTTGRAQGQALIDEGYRVRSLAQNEVALRESEDAITSGELTALLSDPVLLDKIADGTATPEEERRFGILLAQERLQRGEFNPETGEYVPFPDKPLPPYVRQSFEARVARDEARGQPTPPWIVDALYTPPEPRGVALFYEIDEGGGFNLNDTGRAALTGIDPLRVAPNSMEGINALAGELEEQSFPRMNHTMETGDFTPYSQTNYNLSTLWGTSAAFRGIWDKYIPMLTLGAYDPRTDRSAAIAALESFNTMAVLSLMEATTGRDSEQLRRTLERLIPTPQAFLTNSVIAREKYVALRDEQLRALRSIEIGLNPTYGGKVRGQTEQELIMKHQMLTDRIRQVSNLITVIDHKRDPISRESAAPARAKWLEDYAAYCATTAGLADPRCP